MAGYDGHHGTQEVAGDATIKPGKHAITLAFAAGAWEHEAGGPGVGPVPQALTRVSDGGIGARGVRVPHS